MSGLFDPKCYELAEYFLAEHPGRRSKEELASRIQDAVEDYLRDAEEN